ncbi:hypothetical protein SLEP1_g41746 [Rubroshorea leprosula]|uniref:Uncharacterized protein n=1 Tax=Rubroshorea leprosula TaxID=152421 RepID=A0AAV5L7K7_9ROSI|nr:hypothetical protein SLEP1_g41746 [Rubroshorea leprosula]
MANFTLANTTVPSPFDNLTALRSKFVAVGLNNNTDLVALSVLIHLGVLIASHSWKDYQIVKPPGTRHTQQHYRYCATVMGPSWQILIPPYPTRLTATTSPTFSSKCACSRVIRRSSQQGRIPKTLLTGWLNRLLSLKLFVKYTIRMGNLSSVPGAQARGEIEMQGG